jgi:hypothetical protein
MNPQNANPQNFQVENIIYNNDGFSIAIGIWKDDNSRRFAMRWNGDDSNPDDVGYPSVFKHPMWFQLPTDVQGVLAAILENSNPIVL